MNTYYPTCDDTANDSYGYYRNAYEEEDNRGYGNSCHCYECCANSYNTNSTGCYYSDCNNSGTFGTNQYDLGDYMPNASYGARRNYLGVSDREAQIEGSSCACTNHNVFPNYSVDNYLLGRRQDYHTKHLRRCKTYCHYNMEDHACGSSRNIPPVNTHEQAGTLHNHHVGFTRPESPAMPVSSGSLPKESFHSCLPCNSSQVQMVYENQRRLSSKSTINQSSMQTLDSKASRSILRRRPNPKQQRINSGYFEIVSPTHTQSSSSESTNVRLYEQNVANNIVVPETSKKAIHYGYFEVKERNYVRSSTEQIRKISLSELDNVPIKISKEVDTAHLKQSIMLDKSLSANIPQPRVKTSDKALLVDINPQSSHPLTHADIVKIINSISRNQMLQVKKSDKMVQSISNRSLTNFKPPVSVKTSHGKSKRSFHKPKTVLKAVKSISEGSIHLSRKVSSKHSTHRSHDKADVKNYKGYLDVALNKLENQITNKFKSVLLNYAEASQKKRSIVTIYNSATKCAPEKNEIGITPSPTMQTEEDLIDSEEVEIGSTAFDEKSSLSSDVQTAEQKNCNHTSDVSSYNTEKANFVHKYENCENGEKRVEELQESGTNSEEESPCASKECSDELRLSSGPQPDQYVYHSQTYLDPSTLSLYSNTNGSGMTHWSNRSLAPSYRSSRERVCSTDKSLAIQGSDLARRCRNYCDRSNCRNIAESSSKSPAKRLCNTARRMSREFLNKVTGNDGGRAKSGRCRGQSPCPYLRNELSHNASQKSAAGSTHSFEREILSEIIRKSMPASHTSVKSFHGSSCADEHYHSEDENFHSSNDVRKRYLSTVKHDTRHREKSIKFGSPQLCTISEEECPCGSSSQMKLLHEGHQTSHHPRGASHPGIVRKTAWDRTHSTTSTVRHPHRLPCATPLCTKSWDPVTENEYACTPSIEAVDVCRPSHSNEQVETSVDEVVDEEHAPRLEDFIYMDCCMKQTCGNCPKKRYYAKFLPHNDERRTSDGRYCDLQCDYLSHNENRRCCSHGKTNAMNIISFLVFIVMFYGIFQYIDAGVRNGKFPWI